MSGVTTIAAVSLMAYDVSTIVTYSSNVTLVIHTRPEITIVSISCETAVEPVARNHSMRLPVALLSRKNTEMSVRLPIKNAIIDAIWMFVACVNTTWNCCGVTPVHPGWTVSGAHGITAAT